MAAAPDVDGSLGPAESGAAVPCPSERPTDRTSFIGLGESKTVFDLKGRRDGRRVFRLRTSVEAGIRIFTTGSATLDAAVFSEDNDRFVAWAAGGGRANARIDARLPPGAWCIRTETDQGGVYGLHVIAVDSDFDRDGNVALGAETIRVGGEPVFIEGRTDGADDVDYFRLAFDRHGLLTVRGHGEAPVRGEILVYDERARTDGMSGWDFAAADRDAPAPGSLVAGAEVDPGLLYYLVISADPARLGGYRLEARLDGAPSGDAIHAAVPIAPGSLLDRRIRAADDVEYFRIEAREDTGLRIFSMGDIDVRASLLDNDGREVASDDDSGDGGNFSLNARLSGPHHVKVEGVGGSVGDYRIVVTRDDTAPDEGDTIEDATRIPVGGELQAWLRGSDDREDVYRIELAQRSDLRIGTRGKLITWGRLVTADEDLIAVDNESGEDRNFLMRPLLDPGVYYLHVWARGYSGSYPQGLSYVGGPYTLFVKNSDGRGGGDDDDTIGPGANALGIGSERRARIDSNADADYFRFRVDQQGWVRAFTEGRADTVGQLLDLTAHVGWTERRYREPDPGPLFPSWENTVVVATADYGGGGRNFRLEAKLPEGEYAVRVSGGDGSTGNYRLGLESFQDDHGDWAHRATPVAFGGPVAGVIEAPADVDYFRIPVEALADGARIVAFSTGELDTVGSFEDGSGKSLASDDDGGADRNFLLAHDHPGVGTLFVRVASHHGTTGSYVLVVEVVGNGG